MDIHKAIARLPRPKNGFVLPGHKYTGPYNPLDDQLDENDNPLPGHEPYNAVDEISMKHDICYRDNPTGKRKCDEKMLVELEILDPKDIRERIDKSLVRKIISVKHQMGLGIKEKNIWTDELTDELHKPVRKNFPTRRVLSKEVDAIWAADLVDMQYFAHGNKGYKYILMIIDVFSKYGWAIPLKTKTGIEVTKAFSDLWKTTPAPSRLWTDKGREFYNTRMTELLKKYNVHIYSTENEQKSCVVERWNRTIKRMMWKYFTKNKTGVYNDVLPEMIKKYNNTYHRSIDTTPTLARQPSSYQHVYEALYGESKPKTKPKFKVGDKVRITKKKKTFEKGYTTNWTEEVFVITEVQPTNPVTYKIEDGKGEEVKGTFYEPELQRSKQEIFRIDKVLRRRTRNHIKEIYVKWKGYNSNFNQWIPETNLE